MWTTARRRQPCPLFTRPCLACTNGQGTTILDTKLYEASNNYPYWTPIVYLERVPPNDKDFNVWYHKLLHWQSGKTLFRQEMSVTTCMQLNIAVKKPG